MSLRPTQDRLILCFLVIYMITGFIVPHFSHGEMYPVFGWDLFWRLPHYDQQDFVIVIERAGDRHFDPPVLRGEGADAFSTTTHEKTEYNLLIEKLAFAVQKDDEKNMSRAKRALEKNIIAFPVTYQVVRRTYNPIERWRHNTFKSTTTLATFTATST